jgi:dihydrodiol dehydrogenase / D-xylose 1-dehydrogenase (NADP)
MAAAVTAAASSSVSPAPTERTIRWGICGTGTIASDFVTVLKHLPATEVAAVGSRSQASADRFGDRFGVAAGKRYANYAALAADASLDVVYVATPSARHVEDSLMFLEAGRAVLCEKAMAPNSAETARVLECARARGLFFLHGVWSRFFPAMAKIREIIDSGKIGRVVSAHASFCQNDGAGACSATLETGIYCAQFLQWAFGGAAPLRVGGVTHDLDAASGHDVHVGALLAFPGGGVGTFECSLRHPSPRSAEICGTEGVIRVPFPFWCPTKVSSQRMTGLGSQTWESEETHSFALPLPEAETGLTAGDFNFVNSQGLAYEAAEVNRCLRAGLTETPLFSSAECASVMAIISDIRAHWMAPASASAAARVVD